jgi:hypothetical protein
MTSDVPIRPLIAVLALAGCGRAEAPPATVSDVSAAIAALPRTCTADSLRPVTAAPAGGLWAGEGGRPATRVAAMVGPATTDAERARITRRVETLELRLAADSIRLVTDTASVTLELLPPFRPKQMRGRTARPGATEPAAVYVVSPQVVLASYEPCAASTGEPRIRYLRRDTRGVVVTDLMLRRESAETGAIP